MPICELTHHPRAELGDSCKRTVAAAAAAAVATMTTATANGFAILRAMHSPRACRVGTPDWQSGGLCIVSEKQVEFRSNCATSCCDKEEEQ